MANKVTLYIATHNVTGLKYFGKTTRYFTESELQENYHGSGLYWKSHLAEHGDDVNMEIYGVFSTDVDSENYVKLEADKFSDVHNIVNSKAWANLKTEDGLCGGRLSRETKGKIGLSNSKALKGRKISDEHKKNIRKARQGTQLSETTKEKISVARKGKGFTEEHKKKLSESAKNRPPFSEETKKKLSESAKRQWAQQRGE